jgi:NADH:ubiquinone oxidoreductase subunit 2 (subunit N)
MQPFAISFVLIVLLGAVVALVVGILLPRRLQTWNALLAGMVLVIAGTAAALKLGAPPGLVFDQSYAVDAPALWAVLALLATGLLCIGLSVPAFRNDAREAEFYALLLFTLLGAIMLAGANDVMEILLGVLLTSVGSYALVAYRRTSPLALEALLKYYLFGALTNIGLIYGLILLYGFSGSTILGEIGGGLAAGNDLMLVVAAVLVVVGLGFMAPMFVPPADAPPEAPEPIPKAIGVVAALGSIVLGPGSFLLLGSTFASSQLASWSRAHSGPARARVRNGRRRRGKPSPTPLDSWVRHGHRDERPIVFVFFSSRLGCLGSILVSAVLTLILLFFFGVL